MLRDCSYCLLKCHHRLWPCTFDHPKARADKASQLHSSPRCAETLTVNSISEERGVKKRCSQFDALGNHVMKNRLLRIRISQALPHRVLWSRMVCCWCVLEVCSFKKREKKTCMISQREYLTFFNYSLVWNVNSLILRLWHINIKSIFCA